VRLLIRVERVSGLDYHQLATLCPEPSRLRPNRGQFPFASLVLVLGLRGLQLKESGQQRTLSTTSIVSDSPEALVCPAPALFDVGNGGAVHNGNLGKLHLGEVGSLAEGG
jgi:hypothetical protein